MIGAAGKFLKEKTDIDAVVFDDPKTPTTSVFGQGQIIGIKLPIKMELKVTEAADAVKGNTAQGATKQVTLETGASVPVPLFVNQGDVIRVNTETGEYVERASKG